MGESSTSQKFPLVEFYWQMFCTLELQEEFTSPHPGTPFYPLFCSYQQGVIPADNTHEGRSRKSVFPEIRKLWEKCGPSLRHPLDGHQIHFHFSSKQNCLEPDLPHFWICGPPGPRKEQWLCWECTGHQGRALWAQAGVRQ